MSDLDIHEVELTCECQVLMDIKGKFAVAQNDAQNDIANQKSEMEVLYKQLEELRHLAANVNLSQDYLDEHFGATDWAALEKHGLDLNVLEN